MDCNYHAYYGYKKFSFGCTTPVARKGLSLHYLIYLTQNTTYNTQLLTVLNLELLQILALHTRGILKGSTPKPPTESYPFSKGNAFSKMSKGG